MFKSRYTLIAVLIGFLSVAQLYSLGNKFIFNNFNTQANTTVAAVQESQHCKTCIKFKPENIDIEKADIHLPIVSVPLKNGTWNVIPKVANYAEGTSLVNDKDGNVGIYGHDRKDAFTRIKMLKQGDTVVVTGNNYKAIYKVDTAFDVGPDEVNVFYPTEKPTLTLLTCNGIFSQERYIVKANLEKITKETAKK